MKRFLCFLAGATLLLALLLSGCGGGTTQTGETGKEPVKFKIGHCTWIGYGPLYIAKEKGFFQENNIDPELLIIEDESQYAAAVTSGQVEGLANVLDREVIHFANGAPTNVVLALDESAGADGIVAKKEIQSVADLKGATVGLDKSSTSYFFFLAVLNKFGLKESDVIVQEMGAGDAGAAFVAGKLDAAVTWEPWLSKASEREGGHVLVTSKDFPKTIVDVIVLRQDFVEAHPEAVVGLAKAWFKAIDYWRQHPDEGNKIIANALGLTEEEVKEMAAGVNFFGKEENLQLFDQQKEEGTVFQLASLASKFWKEKGIIKSEVDIDDFIKSNYVKEAAK
jgi:NitT/TauT family transport system substrate-binding protein